MSKFLAISTITTAMVSAADRPVIAVMSHPYNATHEYMAASYVKYIESGGGRTLRVPFTANSTQVEEIYKQTSGLLLMGGSATLPQAARDLYSLKLKGDSNGSFYPMWGTCLGFEWINQLVSEDDSIIDSKFNAENISLALDFEDDIEDSRVMPEGGVQTDLAGNYEITMNMHAHGVATEDWLANEHLTDTFNLISTNDDLDGKNFVSTIESKSADKAIYATQWHPEKNNFEYGAVDNDQAYLSTSHSAEAVRLSFELAAFFVGEARKSDHVFKGDLKLAINERTGVLEETSFEERYVFLK
ncbi:hypothetical protein TrLO_g14937 [Triparma laevis f. longispina]|uniref:folate gamma-glutamyl hydrolase n=1 Tax=Triparma laevis f. longispina TaxID=1714387 RepID=A0A9W7FP77_9STRA|nr:hypothetical protein TrLO_g14937 [Triparma laevis f. longispina]